MVKDLDLPLSLQLKNPVSPDSDSRASESRRTQGGSSSGSGSSPPGKNGWIVVGSTGVAGVVGTLGMVLCGGHK